MARKLVVEIVGDTSRLHGAFRRGARDAEGFNRSIGRLRVGFATLAKSVVIVEAVEKALEGLREAFHAATEEVVERAKINAQVNAALKSTGDVANVTAEHIDELSLSLSNLSGYDDEVVKSGQAVLLTFTNIRNYAGRNNKIFDEASAVMVDFAAKTGKALPAAGLAIGRALQDPAKAAGALRRAQVVLTDSEKLAIAAAVKHGDILKAQKLILADLEKRYGGQAKALGQTLPGQINILRERLKDLAGDIGDRLTPSLTRAVHGVVDFVKRFSEARGTRAKFDVAFEGAEELGRKILGLLQDAVQAAVRQIRAVDWNELARAIEDSIASIDWSGIGDAVVAKVRAVDWATVIREAAQGLSDAAVAWVDAIRKGLDSVDWSQVGKYIVDGLVLAVAAAVQFLRNVDWGSLIRAMVRLELAALRAAAELWLGIGKEIARLLFEGLKRGLTQFAQGAYELALRLVLKIIEPFTHLRIGGGWARNLKRDLEAQLAGVETTAKAGGEAIGRAIITGIAEGVGAASAESPRIGAAANRAAADAAQRAAQAAGAGARGDGLPAPPKPRGLASTGLPKSVQNTIARLQLGVDRAQLTKTLRDDLAALRALERYIEQQIRIHGHILELETQLTGVQSQINSVLEQQAGNAADAAKQRKEAAKNAREAAEAARSARQFAVLGLGATGDERVPTEQALRKRFASIRNMVKALDDPAITAMFGKIARLFRGHFGKLTSDVRKFIDDFFDSIDEKTKDRGDSYATKWKAVSVSAIARSLGLTPEQTRALEQRLGAVPGMRAPGTSPAYAGASTGTTINGDVHVHGPFPNWRAVELELAKRSRSRPHPRRGAR